MGSAEAAAASAHRSVDHEPPQSVGARGAWRRRRRWRPGGMLEHGRRRRRGEPEPALLSGTVADCIPWRRQGRSGVAGGVAGLGPGPPKRPVALQNLHHPAVLAHRLERQHVQVLGRGADSPAVAGGAPQAVPLFTSRARPGENLRRHAIGPAPVGSRAAMTCRAMACHGALWHVCRPLPVPSGVRARHRARRCAARHACATPKPHGNKTERRIQERRQSRPGHQGHPGHPGHPGSRRTRTRRTCRPACQDNCRSCRRERGNKKKKKTNEKGGCSSTRPGVLDALRASAEHFLSRSRGLRTSAEARAPSADFQFSGRLLPGPRTGPIQCNGGFPCRRGFLFQLLTFRCPDRGIGEVRCKLPHSHSTSRTWPARSASKPGAGTNVSDAHDTQPQTRA